MCGIVGYIGKNNSAINFVIDALKKLEYRGYDSAGIGFLLNNQISTIKSVGEVKRLENKIKDFNCVSNIAIGHTRWATHGEPSEVNCHPFVDNDNNIVLVHNGIIENYEEIKKQLLNNKVKFSSQTDSEVAVQLLRQSKQKSNLLKISELTKKLKGSFALVIIFKNEPNVIYGVCHKSPLVVGKAKSFVQIVSDSIVLDKECYDYFNLDNNTIVKCSPNSIEYYTYNLELKKIKLKKLEITNSENALDKYSSFMQKEIWQIPNAIKKTLDFIESDKNSLKTLSKIKNYSLNSIHFVACGTALHAGSVAQTFCTHNGIKSQWHYASEFRYNPPPLNKNDLCVFISQSGETADTLEALRICKQKGVPNLAITNRENSTITKIAKCTLYTKAGAEIAVASTKAYNCQIILLYHIIIEIFNLQKKYNLRKDTLNILEKYNFEKISLEMKVLATKIKEYKKIFFIGRDFDLCTAYESSLKLKEISYIHCESFPSGELKHGTLALIDEDALIIGIATQKQLSQKTYTSLLECLSRNGKTILFSNFQSNKLDKIQQFNLVNCKEYISPLVNIIPFQLLSLWTALTMNNNPDKPRNLAKSVTVE